MNRRLTGTAIAAATLLATTLTASPAQAYGTGGFSVGNVRMLSYGCFYHSYQVNLSLGPETTQWSYDARVLAPNGSVFDFAYDHGSGGGPKAITEEMFLCGSLDPVGTYTITGSLETYEGASDYTPTEVALTPASFQVSPYVAPTPPPPPVPPAPVYSDVTGRVSTKMIDDGARFIFRAKSTPTGTVAGKSLKWVLKYDGRTKRITQGPAERDVVKLRFDSGRHVVKVFCNGTRVDTVTVRI